MLNKILISEDMDDINNGVYSKLSELNIKEIQQVQYCDDAYLKIKKGIFDKAPFDLLITDLSFNSDHRKQKYPSGEHLIKALKNEQPELKIIIYTVENRLQKVRKLIQKYKVDAYVCKGRKGLKELVLALQLVSSNKNYISPQVKNAVNDNSDLDLNDFDIYLTQLLSKGMSQEDIRSYLTDKKIIPNSISTIEKRINKLKIQFKAKNTIHLVAIVKDLGLI
jgi:DNA-binding NarL/FixJ family response regulator